MESRTYRQVKQALAILFNGPPSAVFRWRAFVTPPDGVGAGRLLGGLVANALATSIVGIPDSLNALSRSSVTVAE